MTVASALTVAGSIAGVWIALWALLSRIILGEWRWLHHSAIYLGISAALVAVLHIVELSGFVLALALPGNRDLWIGAAALGLALYLHIRFASHLAANRAALVACGIPIVLAASGHWLQMRSQVRDVNHIGAYMRIYPPALRLRPSDKLEDYFSKATLLRGLADQRLIDAIADDPVSDGDGDN
jgi:hypothetical protein